MLLHTGFGLPMAGLAMLLQFYVGAAVLAVVFPAFVLVACDSDPVRLVSKALQTSNPGGQDGGRAAGQGQRGDSGGRQGDARQGPGDGMLELQGLVRVPIFWLALRPTDWVISWVSKGQER